MRRIFVLILVFCSAFRLESKADFLEYFVLKHNKVNIRHSFDSIVHYRISMKNIQEGDSLFIEYHKDAPCNNCLSIVYAIPHDTNEFKNYPIVYGAGTYSASIDLIALRQSSLWHKEFDIFYYEIGFGADTNHKLLMRLDAEYCNDTDQNNNNKFLFELNGEMLSFSKNRLPTITIDTNIIQEGTILTFINNTCKPCENCKQFTVITTHKDGEKEPEELIYGFGSNKAFGGNSMRDYDFGKFPKIDLFELKNYWGKGKIFDVYYFEVGKGAHKEKQLIMQIITK